ncbi:MAG: gliding motility-associated C-terminal domain-containing protein [Cyclobacteriaceae bacterium]
MTNSFYSSELSPSEKKINLKIMALFIGLLFFGFSGYAQETSCTDGIDNDNDGLIDCLDPDCPECAITFDCNTAYIYYMPPIFLDKDGLGGQTGKPSDLYLTTYGGPATVTVKSPDGSFSKTIIIPVGNPQTLPLPDDVITTLTINTGLPLTKGLIITADQPIQATYRLLSFYNQDIVSLYGKASVGYSFYPGSQTDLEPNQFNNNERHFVSVMALEDNTTVTFKNPMALEGRAAGGTFTALINKGQSYVISSQSSNPNTSISGVRVTSNKPIVCVGGSQHTNTPQGGDYDAGIEQVIPAHLTGTTYCAIDGGNPNSVKDYVTIIAIENNTDVQVNNQFLTNLQAGQVYTYKFSDELYKPYVITSANKLYVYHHTTYGSSEFGMGLVPPINTCIGSKRVDFERPGTEAKAFVIIPNAGLSSLKLRGQPYTSFANTLVIPIPNLSGYSRVIFDNTAIAPLGVNNRIESQSLLYVGVLSRSGGTGNYAFYSDYQPKIEVIDPFTNQPATFINAGDVTPGTSRQVCLQLFSCGSNNRINAISPGSQTQSATFNDNCITYTMKAAAPVCATDVISVTIVNEFGIKENVCISFSNQNKGITITTTPANPQLCSTGGSVALSANAVSTVGAITYTWITPDGTTLTGQTVTATLAGPYALTVSNGTGCSQKTIVTVASKNCDDFDNDGVNDNADLDDDNDGILDTIEGNLDTDGDGQPNSKDRDSDNDGIPDVAENGGADFDGDGVIDGFKDANGNGLSDNIGAGLAFIDTDGDGKANSLDLDSDNDGITDITEVRGSDLNNDGKIDNFTDQDGDGFSDNVDFSEGGSPIFTTSSDTDNNGLPNGLPPQADDRDSDGKVNFLDIDADNDGIVDNIESQTTTSYVSPTGSDTDNDGIDNAYDNIVGFGGAGNNPLLANADGGTAPDYVDTDSDNDGRRDEIEGWDTNNNGVIDGAEKTGGTLDIDNDGLLDGYDNTISTTVWNPTNGTAPTSVFYPNKQNPTTTELDWRDNTANATDSDGDGVADLTDVDDDNDGILDTNEENGVPGRDTDGDGVPNILDLDSENDGIPDLIENGGVDANGDGRIDNFTDTDVDGLANIYDVTNGGTPAGYKDFDFDGKPNAIDIDADNDGITDIVEVRGDDFTSNIFNGIVDGPVNATTDVDRDGYLDKVDPIISIAGNPVGGTPIIVAIDTNADGIPDSFPDDNPDIDIYPIFLDIDADIDGIVDNIEAQLTATYVAPTGVDSDGDGLDNAYDLVGQTGLNPALVNSDGGSAPDYTDRDSDNDGVRDEVEGWDTNNDGVAETFPGTTDADADGLRDGYDSNIANTLAGKEATNGGKTPSFYPDLNKPGGDRDWRQKNDFDGDNIADDVDLDDDNDGILDGVEGIVDTDGDGSPNNRDIDSDNDGIVDFIEAQSSFGAITYPSILPDLDGDGILDTFDSAPTSLGGNSKINPVDTDGDTIPDYLDDDSDGDTFLDKIESYDTNNNGVIDGVEKTGGVADLDNDGLLDGYEDSPATIVIPFIATADNVTNKQKASDFLNIDQTFTSELDWREANSDFDKDGVSDVTDLDDDNDGILDLDENLGVDAFADADSDGILNYLDPTPGTGLPVFVDSNGDGINDIYDVDLDGRINSLDLDTDNDGVPDVVEAGGVDTDGNGKIDCPFSNVNGLATCLPVTGLGLLLNNDGDSVPNFKDLDSDNDGIGDIQETLGDAQDTDRDGKIDNLIDSDKDGFADVVDGDVGNDGTAENTANALIVTGTDTNGDGKADSYPRADDVDGDGKPNMWDLDSDNDGITDAVESTSTDGDGDGIFDLGNNNGIVTPAVITASGVVKPLDVNATPLSPGLINIDTDGDGIFNSYDLDSDNDGIADVIEAGGVDSNDDGIVDGFATDTNNNGLADSVDPGKGGTPLIKTGTDTDNDLIPNSYLTGDFDKDALPNFLDIDSDNDGIVDNIEAQATTTYIAPAGTDVDKDGVDDAYDGNNVFGIGNKIVKPVDDTDDADTAPDYLDLDSDGDGVPDNIEGWDINGNRKIDGAEPPTGGTLDVDKDGLLDQYDKNKFIAERTNGTTPASYPDIIKPGDDRDWRQATDRDGDGIPDGIDADDDNDGIIDTAESNGVDPLGDADGDGLANYLDSTPGTGVPTFADANGDGISDAFDTDSDGVINAFDLDGDNDGIPDLVEAGGVDTNGDGRIDSIVDVDKDGLMDLYDTSQGGKAIADLDTDGDGIPNRRDTDSDNDGIPDVVEAGGTDANNDGKIDAFADTDGDGFADSVDGDVGNDGTAENTAKALIITGTDTNGDGKPDSYPRANADANGLPNPYDLDSDGDGILDTIEAGILDTNKDGIADGTGGADGWSDTVDGLASLSPTNTDGKGKPNYLDIDSDDDGIVDVIEAQPTASYKAPSGIDADGDGLDDAFDNAKSAFGGNPFNGIIPIDTDIDSTPDYQDLDSDGDSLADNIEGWDTNGNGVIDGNEPVTISSADIDGDGLLDQYDKDTTASNPTNGTTPASYPDVNNPGVDRDWREVRRTDIVVPEIFSPNGDGVNDFFEIFNPLNKAIKLTVFNRWGNMVYAAERYDNTWNGVATQGLVIGSDLPDGTYFYLLVIDGEEQKPKSFTLKR